MKRLLATIFALIISAASTTSFGQPSPEQFSPHVKQFLSQCSGFRMNNPQAEAMAFFTCLGRMRGVIDGHELTMYLYNEQHSSPGSGTTRPKKDEPRLKRLWCIPVQMPTANAFVAVLSWVDENAETVAEINKAMTNPMESSLSVMLAALRQSFPCTEV